MKKVNRQRRSMIQDRARVSSQHRDASRGAQDARGGRSVDRNSQANQNAPAGNIRAQVERGVEARPSSRNAENAQISESEVNPGAQSSQDQFVTMKKSKKFIKFKDYIIKLPNSMGLIGSRVNNDQISFVESSSEAQNPIADNEGPGGSNIQNSDFFRDQYHMHPNLRYRDKGYSIYVVDDEHEIHRFDIDTYEWSIITTTKDQD
jgi:hypothetical protein